MVSNREKLKMLRDEARRFGVTFATVPRRYINGRVSYALFERYTRNRITEPMPINYWFGHYLEGTMADIASGD